MTTTQTIPSTTKEQTVTTSSVETTTIVPTTTQPEIDWEKINELDEEQSERNTGIFTPIFSSIVNTLMTIGSTIVYQICTSFQLYIVMLFL